jgi:hypothetical protein
MAITIDNPPAGAIPITEAQWAELIGGEPRDISGEMETAGPWHLPVRFRALAVSSTWDDYSIRKSVTIYGMRTMSRPIQAGYQLEGSVSLGGRKYSAFTSSELFELPDGRLFNVSTIHARVKP